LVLITPLRPEDGRPENEVVTILRERGIVGRIMRVPEEVLELRGESALLLNWLKIIPARVIDQNCVLLNVHSSLLPRYRGRHAFAWAIIHGETEVGYTLHAIDEGIDTGPIYDQCRLPVHSDSDVNDVFARGNELLKRWLPDALDRFRAGLLRPVAQDARLASYFRTRTAEDGRIWWGEAGVVIHNLVRALRPPYTPGAFFCAGNKVFHVDQCQIEPAARRWEPGLVVDVDAERNAASITCGDGVVHVTMVSRPGAPTARDLRLSALAVL
jgi:methionyl-tRNA formyltransferase